MKKLTVFFLVIFTGFILTSIYAQDTTNTSNVQTSIAEKIEKTRGISPYINLPSQQMMRI